MGNVFAVNYSLTDLLLSFAILFNNKNLIAICWGNVFLDILRIPDASFYFHWVSDNLRAQKVIYVMHGNHHEFPRDKQRLFMPPVPSLFIASVIFLLMYALMRENTMAFFPGFMLGYLIYGTMHFAIHAWNPPLNG